MTAIDIRELPARLDEALTLASTGQEVLLVDGTIPRARLVPCVSSPRVPGLHPGVMRPGADFDDPLPEQFWTGPS